MFSRTVTSSAWPLKRVPGEDTLTRRDRLDPVSHGLHFARHLAADHTRHLRTVRVQPRSGKRVGKVDLRRLDRDPHLTGSHRRIGPLLDLKDLGPPCLVITTARIARDSMRSEAPRGRPTPAGPSSRRPALTSGRSSPRTSAPLRIARIAGTPTLGGSPHRFFATGELRRRAAASADRSPEGGASDTSASDTEDGWWFVGHKRRRYVHVAERNAVLGE